MASSWNLITISTLLLMIAIPMPDTSLQNAQNTKGRSSQSQKIGNGTLRNKFFKGYRVVNWCLTGKDEPQLHMWPFSQFVPLIKRNRRYTSLDPANNRYRLEITEIYSRMPWVGATVNCHGEEDPPPPPRGQKRLPNETFQRGPWCENLEECQNWNTTNFDCNDKFIYDFPTEKPPVKPTPVCTYPQECKCSDQGYIGPAPGSGNPGLPNPQAKYVDCNKAPAPGSYSTTSTTRASVPTSSTAATIPNTEFEYCPNPPAGSSPYVCICVDSSTEESLEMEECPACKCPTCDASGKVVTTTGTGGGGSRTGIAYCPPYGPDCFALAPPTGAAAAGTGSSTPPPPPESGCPATGAGAGQPPAAPPDPCSPSGSICECQAPPPAPLPVPTPAPLTPKPCFNPTTTGTGSAATTVYSGERCPLLTFDVCKCVPPAVPAGAAANPIPGSTTPAEEDCPPEPTVPTTTAAPPPESRWNMTGPFPRAPDCTSNAEECRPAMKNATVLKYLGRLYKTVHITFKAEERRKRSRGIYEKWEPQKIEGVLIQANHNPFGIGLPTGEFFNEDFTCFDCGGQHFAEIIPCRKRPSIEVVHPTVMAFHHMMKVPFLLQPNSATGFTTAPVYEMRQVGKKSEVHVNFRWHSPPCTETTRLEFTVLVVRSFKNSDFDVFDVGPYEVIKRGHIYVSDIIPTPIFRQFFYDKKLQGTFCHNDDSPDIQTVHPKVLSNFEMSHSYDECLRTENNPTRKEIGDFLHAQHKYLCEAPGHPKCFPASLTSEKRHFDFEEPFGFAEEVKCPSPCPDGPTTTPLPVPPKRDSIFKREHHGGMLIMTNFCLMPVCSFIARFYKETFNISRIKGVKMWFWAHILGSIVSSIFIYFGTFHSGKDFNKTFHVYLGKSYIMILAATYFSAWGRNKATWINKTAEFFHGTLGYVTIVMAHASMHAAPGVGWIPKMLVDLQVMIHVLFIGILTVHVCNLDKKFGMRPARRHFPTVEARFDDIPIPHYKFRVIVLIILTAITFILSSIALFVE